MKAKDFELYRDVLCRECGMVIGDDKAYLLNSRLGIVAKKAGCDDIGTVTERVRAGDEDIRKHLVEAMLIKDTAFFRDVDFFGQLESVFLPYVAKRKEKGATIRIWCTGSSTGQEPYSVAMLLQENAAYRDLYKFEIIATDLSEAALMRAKKGVYSQADVQCGVPSRLLVKYFEQSGSGGLEWVLRDDIKSMVTFERSNLLAPSYNLEPCDIVLCRDVFTHFDRAAMDKTLGTIRRYVHQDGLLCLDRSFADGAQGFQPFEGYDGIYTAVKGEAFIRA